MTIKKRNLFVVFSALFFFNMGLQAEVASSSNTKHAETQAKSIEERNKINDEKYEILQRDEADYTDDFIIPYGESEIEEEERLNRLEKKETFALPKTR